MKTRRLTVSSILLQRKASPRDSSLLNSGWLKMVFKPAGNLWSMNNRGV